MLWLEFEEFDDSAAWDAENEYFNMSIKVDGRTYALNVWSFGFLQGLIDGSREIDCEERAYGYIAAPDLIVETCTRANMEKAVRHMLDTGALRTEWLVSGIES